MKVLLVNKFNYLRGGADKYFLDLADILSQNGVEVAKFSMSHPENIPDKYEQYFLSPIDFNRFKAGDILKYLGRIFYSREAAKKFEQLLSDFKPDIIHIHNIYHQISPSILPVAKRFNIPVVMHLHDYKLLCPNYRMYNKTGICERCKPVRRGKGGRYYNCAMRRCLKNSFFKSLLASLEMYFHHSILKIYEKNVDLFIAPSEFMRDKAIEWGIDKSKIVLQPYFIKIADFKPETKSGDYLLYFGRLSEEKGLMTLLDAIEKIGGDLKLKIVGTGPEYKNIEARIRERKLENKIELAGPKYGDELRDIIRKSLAAVVPSEWYEVSGIVNMEAAASGKPVIAARIGGIPEIVKDGENGFLFRAGDSDDLVEKIKNLLSSDIESLGARAVRSADKFSQEEHLKGILNIYKRYAKQ